MHTLAVEQSTNFGDVAISLGGSVLVAIVSVATIILSNMNARRLKTDDYRREELEAVADAVESARSTIEQMVSAQYLVRSLQRYEIASRERDSGKKQTTAAIAKFLDLRRTMEKNLLRISITNPNHLVRESATMVDDVVTVTYEQGLVHWESNFESAVFHETVTEQVDLAKDCFKTFRAVVYQIYHDEKYTNRAIRKSDMLENDKKIAAARTALDGLKEDRSLNTDGKTQ